MVYNGGFIIPTGKFNDTHFLYFGVEAKGKCRGQISAFGGKRDQADKNIQATARREFKEESRGVFVKNKRSIAKRLENRSKYHVQKVVTRNTTVTYFVPLKIKGNPMARFNQTKGKLGVQKEMSEVVAVKAKKVIQAVKQTPVGTPMTLHGKPVRPLLASVLREGVRNGYIS